MPGEGAGSSFTVRAKGGGGGYEESGRLVWGSMNPRLARVLRKLGYERLLPIQVKAFHHVYNGYNTLIVAPTGSGKTEASLIPIISRMLDEGLESGGGVKVIYISPLRALNRDLEYRIQSLASETGYRVQTRHGDTGQSGRRRFIEDPPDIMITTPESLGLLLTVRKARKALSQVRWVIVDELHELMESERGVELSLNLEKLESIVGSRIQRVGLSATLSERSLEDASKLLAYGRHVSLVIDTTPKRYQIRVETFSGGKDEGFWRRGVDKIAGIIAQERGSVLIFSNTRSTVEALSLSLSKKLGTDVPAHHGSLSRHVRERVEKDFREGRVKAIVATSSLELGIDIGKVGLVVQFMSPRQVLAMVQRAGRAGHRFGETSRAVIVTVDNLFEAVEAAVIANRAMRGDLEDLKVHKNPYDVLAHFTAGSAIDGTPGNVDEIYVLATSTYPYSSLSRDEIEGILDLLDSIGVVRIGEDGSIRMSRRTMSYFYRVSMIPDEKAFKVHDIISGRDVGEIGERFLQLRLMKAVDPRTKPLMVLGGRVWRILDVDVDTGKVLVSPEGEIEGLVPVWEGELIPVDFKVAREVCSIISLAMADRGAGEKLLRSRGLSERAVSRILDVVSKTVESWGGTIFSWRRPVVEDSGGMAVLYTCLGSKGNFALAMLLAKALETVIAVEFHYLPYAIVFKGHAQRGIARAVARALETLSNMDGVSRAGLLYDSVRSSRAYLVRFYQVAKRMGVVDLDATLSIDMVRRMADTMRGTPVDVETVRELVHEKLDIGSVNRFLDDFEEVQVVEPEKPSPLAMEVFTNPYLRVDTAVNLKALGLDKIIASKRSRLSEKRVTMLCLSCGRAVERRVGDIPPGKVYRCEYCSAVALAPLPPTEIGSKMLEAYFRRRRGARLTASERKLAKEVEDRARIYMQMAVEGKSRYAVEALSARGVGPKKARSLLRELQLYGEQRFYMELIKAEEDYAATRRFWKEGRKS